MTQAKAFGIRDSGFGARGWGLAAAAIVVASGCAPAPQTGNTPAPGTAMSRAIVDPYLKIQTALAADSVDGIRQNAGEIATAATTLGAPAMKVDMAALQLAATTELPDARTKFGALSDAIDTYMTGLHLAPPDGVKIATCPMVKKPWMQEGDTIANPYYGKEMPTCGSFR
jgi:HPt (histidine-containing phosphotransfer) domain-containing protein